MRFILLSLALSVSACLAPPSAAERATDAARNLNVAARFGRMDVAMELTNQGVRKKFIENRAAWGKDVRVLDVELASFNMPAGDRAEVEIDYSWSSMTDGQLRSTRISQEWRDPGGGFVLFRERRISGDLGLFGEQIPPSEAPPRHDVQFATKVIR
jgi:hypothetical protein